MSKITQKWGVLSMIPLEKFFVNGRVNPSNKRTHINNPAAVPAIGTVNTHPARIHPRPLQFTA